jgi:hypothetical protein
MSQNVDRMVRPLPVRLWRHGRGDPTPASGVIDRSVDRWPECLKWWTAEGPLSGATPQLIDFFTVQYDVDLLSNGRERLLEHSDDFPQRFTLRKH